MDRIKPNRCEVKEAKMAKSLLSSVDVFKGLENSEIDLLQKAAQEVIFPAEKIIFKEGENGDKIYLVVEGVVEIWKSEGNELKGSRLARLKPGEIFGEMALFDKEPRSATAVAAIAKETKIWMWQEKNLAQLTETNPNLAIKILTNVLMKISKRLRIANDAIHTLLRSNQYIGL